MVTLNRSELHRTTRDWKISMSNEIKYYSVLQDDHFEQNMKKWSGMYMFESVLALRKYVGNLNWCPDGGQVFRKVLAEDGLNARVSQLQLCPLSVWRFCFSTGREKHFSSSASNCYLFPGTYPNLVYFNDFLIWVKTACKDMQVKMPQS